MVEIEDENGVTMNSHLVSTLREFIENEAKSCSMDYGCITPSMSIECGEDKCRLMRLKRQ